MTGTGRAPNSRATDNRQRPDRQDRTARGIMELVAPAGTPAALRTAIAVGADVVYCGFRDATNARNFPGLNFSRDELAAGIAHAHAQGAGVYLACNTYPQAGREHLWRQAVDDAASLGVDAVILADIGLLGHARDRHPDLRLHLSVQASASNEDAIAFYQRHFGVRRVVLPRVLSLADIAALNRRITVETEVFAFGGMCVMAEGRCALSSYVTGESPNTTGACSPAAHVRYQPDGDATLARLGAVTVDRFAPGEPVGYPTLCKGRFSPRGATPGTASGPRRDGVYLFEDPVSLNVEAMLPELAAAGVRAIKIEGRQRGRAYVEAVVTAFRRALDRAGRGDPATAGTLAAMSEGGSGTAGAYRRGWQ